MTFEETKTIVEELARWNMVANSRDLGVLLINGVYTLAPKSSKRKDDSWWDFETFMNMKSPVYGVMIYSINPDRKIQGIKSLRSHLPHLGLREAKDIVDQVLAHGIACAGPFTHPASAIALCEEINSFGGNAIISNKEMTVRLLEDNFAEWNGEMTGPNTCILRHPTDPSRPVHLWSNDHCTYQSVNIFGKLYIFATIKS